MSNYLYAGVDTNIPGTGGPKCINYLSPQQLLCETVVISGLYVYLLRSFLPKLVLQDGLMGTHNVGRRYALLTLHCVIFSFELAYKFSTQSLLWIFNPCHVLTICQIFILACRPCKLNTAIFRLHLHMLNGPLLALAFPVLNTRLLLGECFIFFVQHFLIFLVPVILLDQSSVYSAEPLDDLSWAFVSLSLQVLYHFLFLQPLALITGINLNNILCPALSDPFKGPYFRLLAMVHQPLLIIILGKCITCFSLSWAGQPWPWAGHTSLQSVDQQTSLSVANTRQTAMITPLLGSTDSKLGGSQASGAWYLASCFGYDTATPTAHINPPRDISSANGNGLIKRQHQISDD